MLLALKISSSTFYSTGTVVDEYFKWAKGKRKKDACGRLISNEGNIASGLLLPVCI